MNKFWLTNVRLESGFRYENGMISGTETEVSHLKIEDGRIMEIINADRPLNSDLPQIDALGLLLVPSFIEKHCHLDKTIMSDSWRASQQVDNIFERMDIEKKLLPSLKTKTADRAISLLNVLQEAGSTHVRTHVDIYPEAGISNLEEIQKALEVFSGKLTHEIVAFAQHGLLHTNSIQLVREALRNGAGIVGAVDPANVDGNIEASLQQLMELAVEADADVDLHLHDPGHLGTFTMKRLAHLTKEANYEGRVAISHAFGLGQVPKEEAVDMAERLSDAGITIVTSVPLGREIPPVDLLHNKGVKVEVGCDNIFDSWSPLGNGDILERASRLAERFKWIDERSLANTLGFITGGIKPLNEKGERNWPQPGDEANMILTDASCTAEMIARRSKRQTVFYKGNVVAGKLPSYTNMEIVK